MTAITTTGYTTGDRYRHNSYVIVSEDQSKEMQYEEDGFFNDSDKLIEGSCQVTSHCYSPLIKPNDPITYTGRFIHGNDGPPILIEGVVPGLKFNDNTKVILSKSWTIGNFDVPSFNVVVLDGKLHLVQKSSTPLERTKNDLSIIEKQSPHSLITYAISEYTPIGNIFVKIAAVCDNRFTLDEIAKSACTDNEGNLNGKEFAKLKSNVIWSLKQSFHLSTRISNEIKFLANNHFDQVKKWFDEEPRSHTSDKDEISLMEKLVNLCDK